MRDRGWGVGVHVHRAERTDALVGELARVLAQPPPDPFTPDLVAVPTPGIERFISQGLGLSLGAQPGRRDGVCANVEFGSPDRLVAQVLTATTGVTPEVDPWAARRTVWPLLEVIDRSAGEPWCAGLTRHLGLDPTVPDPEWERLDRRFAVAARLARLFASYASQRPDLLRDWAGGGAGDGAGARVPDDLAWQPELWRRLRSEIGTPSPAERLASACRTLASDPGTVDLPARLSLFGPSRLPTDHLEVLSALGAAREVHLWLADASPALWEALPAGADPPRRSADRSAEAARHPLLRSLGRDARELRLRLGHPPRAGADRGPATDGHIGPAEGDPAGDGPVHLLTRLQTQVRDNLDPRATTAGPPLQLEDTDASVQVHACHGQARQAEVVREVVLGLLQADPTLEPRDILLMCPDLATFAPLLSAAFSEPAGPGTPTDGSLRLRIADRTPEQSNTVLAALAALLDLLPGRVPLSGLLDLAAQPPVRARFGFDETDLERLAELATSAGVRWGLDQVTRADHLLRVGTGTWRWALDRMLLGVAMSEDGLPVLDGVLPLDDVQGGDVELVGRLAELVGRVQGLRDLSQEEHSVAGWIELLRGAVTDLMDARGPESWQVPHALAALAALGTDAGDHAEVVQLCLADVRWLVDDLLAGRPTRTNFRSGAMTVCGLVPMRSVPHRVICLVGMDDGAFPRTSVADGDDVLARDPLVGERDPRSEDRQLLLDAIMAATDHLVVTYTGADDRTNEARPPCVPVGELLDTIDAMATCGSGAPAHSRVRVVHPLQPFDPRNFTAGALGVPGPFSHDEHALAGAQAATGPRVPQPPLLVGDLPEHTTAELSVRALGDFLAAPMRSFLRARIGIPVGAEDTLPDERIPIALDGLARWSIGDRTLTLLARGESAAAIARAEGARGTLPPGALGDDVLREVGPEAAGLAEQAERLRSGPARHVSLALDLAGGVRLVGTIPDVHGARIARATFSRSRAAQALHLWPELLAVAVAEPAHRWSAHLVTRDGGWALRAPDPPEAARILAQLAALHRAGMRAPLPLTATCGYEYARRRLTGQPVSAAQRAAQSAGWQARFGPEQELPEVVIRWGPGTPFETLLAEAPEPDEDWYPDEPSRFGALARRIWQPLLAAGTEAS